MCDPGQPVAVPASTGQALAALEGALSYLARADAGSLLAAEQAACLRVLERAESMQTAARASVLAAFSAQAGFEDDGHGSARTWLRWQTRITGGAAAGAVGWMRRLSAHPRVRQALACGEISASWAREICGWSDDLPTGVRDDADAILLAAAAGGAELADLAGLAQEMRKRTAAPDHDDGNDGFADRSVRLETTFRGAGRLEGDLTPQCAAALQAILDSLGKKAGPEDTRTRRQRDHDALEEACRRLIAAGCLPDRAGQPTQIQLHMSLDQLRGLDGAASATDAWAAAQASGSWSAPAGPGSDCDATIMPVVTGTVDPGVLDRLAALLLGQGGPERDAARREQAERAAREIILRHAADLLSGPAGLAAYLRTGLLENLAASVSLPLDVGTATETIPAHLRRAVITRDRRCRFPGCHQPVAACQPHHIIPRSRGGSHSLTNLLLMCSFHHLIAVHRWGWGIALHPDGTTTATSPDGKRTLHSHSPPARAA